MIFSNYPEFIERIYNKLIELGIDANEIKIDHIGYQASSHDDYDNKISEVKTSSTQVSENIVGGRRVSVFTIDTPLKYEDQEFSVFEIFEPREGQDVNSDWEHVEFLVDGTLEDFISKYPTISFDTSVMNRDEFPMLILHLGDGYRAKFPRKGVLEEVERQIS